MTILDEKYVRLQLGQKSSFSIGRNAASDIQLPHPTVSDTHAHLELLVSAGQKPSLFLRDHKSKYGLYVEGHRIPSTFVTENSDIQISVFKLRVRLCESSIEVRILQTEEQFTLECHKLSYFCGKKALVNNVDLVVKPGEFIGLFGPSGSGKTSLLRLLTGFCQPTSGSIAMGGMAYQNYFDLLKNFIAYVPQEDILHAHLTVRETLEYAAKLRLPEDVQPSQLKEYVDQIVEQLDLFGVQDQEVATLSGGQRKRVNIGAELITKPRILIADEPDAGLDPHIQEQVMDVFRRQARLGNAVVMTTHTLENFQRFDYVAIVDRGNLCFFGRPQDALGFFGGEGERLSLPMEIYRQLSSDASGTGRATGDQRAARYVDSRYYHENFASRVTGIGGWAANGKETWPNRLRSGMVGAATLFGKNSLRQLWILSHRNLLLRVGFPKSLAVYLLIPLVIALVLATQKVRSSDELCSIEKTQKSLQVVVEKGGAAPGAQTPGDGDKVLAAFAGNPSTGVITLSSTQQRMLLNPKFPHVVPLTLVLAAIFCGTFIACSEVSQERQIFAREHQLSVGICNYLLSKLPFLFSVTFIQMSVLMLSVALVFEIDRIAFNQCIVVLTAASWASASLGLLLSCLDKTGRNSIILSIGVIVPQIIFSGAIGPDFYSGMNRVGKLVSDLSISRWAFEGMLRIMNSSTVVSWGPCIVNHQVGFPQPATPFGIDNFYTYAALCGFTVLFLALSGITLKLQDK